MDTKLMLNQIEQQINKLYGKKEQLQDNLKALKKKRNRIKHQRDATEKALIISQQVAQATQEELEFRISDIVSLALNSVFDDPYEFKIKFEIKRGKTEASLVFIKDGNEYEPEESTGGGVVDIAAFALRIACLLINQPPLRKTIILDEPFRFVSSDLQEKVKELLDVLSKKLGIQFIIVTHEELILTGNIIRIK